jgi:hypothetical protein
MSHFLPDRAGNWTDEVAGSTHPNDAFTQIRMPGLRKRAGPALPAGLRYPRLRAAIAVHECSAPGFDRFDTRFLPGSEHKQ